MARRDQVYQKFGEASEAAQLLETELGTLLLEIEAIEKDLIVSVDKDKSALLLNRINKSTLGQLINKFNQGISVATDELCDLLEDALAARNRLTHSFFRLHNLRINSNEGREIMLADLEELHLKIFVAYTKLLLIQGIDLSRISNVPQSGHLPIK